MELSTTAGIWIAAGLTGFLAVLHVLARSIRKLPMVPESATGSFAGGLAVAYVFLHLLPELADGNENIGRALRSVTSLTPLTELGIFLVALVGFLVFYGLERLAQHSAERGVGAPDRGVFVLHLGAFFVYNALITYTMPLRVRTGLAFAVLFTIAMALHFVLTDRGLEEHYGELFDRRSRVLLAAALVLGWLLAAVASPTSVLVVSLLTALLAGSVLLNVFKDEVPASHRSSFGWFVTGVGVYSAILAAVTAAG